MGDPPVISSLVASPDPVPPGGQTVLTCVASDPDGTIDTYEWSAPDGSFPGGGTVEITTHPTNFITWTAPAATGVYALSCKVTDNDFSPKTDTETVDVTVGFISPRR